MGGYITSKSKTQGCDGGALKDWGVNEWGLLFSIIYRRDQPTDIIILKLKIGRVIGIFWTLGL